MTTIQQLVCFALVSMISIQAFASDNKQPNILFAIADDMSHASAYGYKFVNTPNLDQLAKQGLLFKNMFTPSSKCSSSRAVVITGRNPWQLEVAANHSPNWPKKFKSFVQVLAKNGYHTGFTGKGWGPGNTHGILLTGKEYNHIKRTKKPAAAGINKLDYTENFKAFYQDKPKNEPFFFWFGSKEPHRSYEFKSGVKNGKSFADLDFLPTFWGNSEQVKHDILDYSIEVEDYDTKLGEILQYLESKGELGNTLVVVTSDNGMPFPRYKGHPFDFSTRVPFVVSWPNNIVAPGRAVTSFTSFTDIAPTMLEVAQIKQNDMQPIEGKSLVSIFNNKNANTRNSVVTGRERNDPSRPNGWGYPVRSIHTENYVYTYNFEENRWPSGTPDADYRDTDHSPTKYITKNSEQDGLIFQANYGKRPQQELYDLKKDPECLTNLANKPAFKQIQAKLHDELFAELTKQADPRMFGQGDVFDQYEGEARAKKYHLLVEIAEKGSYEWKAVKHMKKKK